MPKMPSSAMASPGACSDEEVRLLEVELAQALHRHARAARHHDVRHHQAGIGQGGPGDDRAEAVGDHGQRLLGLQAQRGDEVGQVVRRRRQVVRALDGSRRRGQDVGRVVVALPQDDGGRGTRLVEVARIGDPFLAQVRPVTDAGNEHGDVLGRLEIAEEERVVLQLRAVHQDVGPRRQDRLEKRDPILVVVLGRGGEVHLRRGKVVGRPTGQQLLSAHGTGYAAPAHPSGMLRSRPRRGADATPVSAAGPGSARR